jgi:hypothetical protein
MKLLSYALRKTCQHSWHIFLSAGIDSMGWENYARHNFLGAGLFLTIRPYSCFVKIKDQTNG